MSKVEVNQISSQCGSTLTIGQSGDTVTLACGATQTGFGRTGTVDWDTTAKTASFTAVSGNGYFVNTTSGAITVTLPATPSAGDIVSISDYANTSTTNNITVARNGSNIEGSASDLTIENNGIALTFVYVDGTRGWKVVNAGKEGDKSGVNYIQATGGTETTCGDYKIHTFTGPGTFCVSCAGTVGTVDYLVVAGGGGGSGYGGGGAGGYRESSGAASGCYTASPLGACVSALPVTAQGYPITVGAGAASKPGANDGGNYGNPSVFSSITSTGGGGGGPAPCGVINGGSGGGGYAACGGTGNAPPVSPPQGNDGGIGFNNPAAPASQYSGGGGGGATQAGGNSATPTGAGSGGDGATTSISGSPTSYAGGGGGAAFPPQPDGTPQGGLGGGGPGGYNITSPTPRQGVNGTANTGGGGGASSPGCNPSAIGAAGGSGIVIIRYKYQ
jgi:hypothetical protein